MVHNVDVGRPSRDACRIVNENRKVTFDLRRLVFMAACSFVIGTRVSNVFLADE